VIDFTHPTGKLEQAISTQGAKLPAVASARPPLASGTRSINPRSRLVRSAFPAPTGYKRIVGELQNVGISLSATSVRTILIRHGLPPATQRDEYSWRAFLRQHATTTLACDFFTVETAWLKRLRSLLPLAREPPDRVRRLQP
jgi:hypothetical protein